MNPHHYASQFYIGLSLTIDGRRKGTCTNPVYKVIFSPQAGESPNTWSSSSRHFGPVNTFSKYAKIKVTIENCCKIAAKWGRAKNITSRPPMSLCAICATKIHCTFRDKFRFCQTNQNLLPKSGPKGTHCSCERNGMIHSYVRTFPKQLPKVKLWSFDDFHVGFFESPCTF